MTIAWWQKAAAQNMPLALHNLAHLYLGGDEGTAPNYDKAREYLEQASKLGLPRSQYTLGKMYEYGLGIDRDDAKAIELYKLSAERGFDKAQYNLGKMSRDGRGVRRRVPGARPRGRRVLLPAALYRPARPHVPGVRAGRRDGPDRSACGP